MSNLRHFYKCVHFNIFSSESNYLYNSGCHVTTKGTVKVKKRQIWLMSLMSKMNFFPVTYFIIAVSLCEKSDLTFRISECLPYLVVRHLQRHDQQRKQLPAFEHHKWKDYQWNMKGQPPITLGKRFKFHIWRYITSELIQKLNVWTNSQTVGKKEIGNRKYIKLFKARKKQA